jgi:hypothetical protein
MNVGLPEYEAGVSTTRPRRSVAFHSEVTLYVMCYSKPVTFRIVHCLSGVNRSQLLYGQSKRANIP